MKSIRSLIGMMAISSGGGRRLGRVLKLSFDEALSGLDGIWIAGRLGKTMFCPAEDVEMLGDVAVIVGKISRRKPQGEPFRMRKALDASGALIGAIVGAYVSEETLIVEELEMSLGFWEDVAGGRKSIRHFSVRTPGGDVVVSEKGGEENEEELGSRYDRRRDDRRIRGDGLWHDELADGAEDGKSRDECGSRNHGQDS
ncbi:MAG: hypothetical protein IJC48_02135 [Clostridia bacterium]|nr:hypothetical protein [Clostridia bacterium]